MRSFQRSLTEFDARGIRVVAISTDPAETTRGHCQKLGFTYTFLSDPKAEVVRSYGLLHPSAGPNGEDIARPAEFLIDSHGLVRWMNLTGSVTARARPEVVIEAFDQLDKTR